MDYYDEDGNVLTRAEALEIILNMYGNQCFFPGCDKEFDDNKHMLTIDHHVSKSRARKLGWDETSIHGISNLRPMGKSCNSKKSSYEYNENGDLDIPVRPPKLPKAKRPEQCKECNTGRKIYPGDTCEWCGRGAQPTTAPGVYQKHYSKCSHGGLDHCAYCWAYHPEMRRD